MVLSKVVKSDSAYLFQVIVDKVPALLFPQLVLVNRALRVPNALAWSQGTSLLPSVAAFLERKRHVEARRLSAILWMVCPPERLTPAHRVSYCNSKRSLIVQTLLLQANVATISVLVQPHKFRGEHARSIKSVLRELHAYKIHAMTEVLNVSRTTGASPGSRIRIFVRLVSFLTRSYLERLD